MNELLNLSWNTNWNYLIPLTFVWVTFLSYGFRSLATIRYWETVSLVFICSLPFHGWYFLAGAKGLPLYIILIIAFIGLFIFKKDSRRMGCLTKEGHLRLLGIGRKKGITIKSLDDLQNIDAMVLSNQEYISLEDNENKFLRALIIEALRLDVEVLPISSFLQEEYGYIDTWGKLNTDEIGMRRRRILRGTKRVVDSILALTILLVTLPVILLVALAILVVDGRPIFFKQPRLGKGGRPFDILKFRTMPAVSEGKNSATKLGTILRQTHLDELPQLLNILRGDMAIVGPRPEWVLLSTPTLAPREYWLRQAVRPGLTGWAQVCYKPSRTRTMRNRKLGYDLFYINNRSVLLDILIWFRTLRRLPVFFYSIFARRFRDRSI